jgi:ABC-2 type transport system ATP-binding protein
MDTPISDQNSSPSWVIDVRNLSKSFNTRVAVDHVSIRVKAGEIFGFLGPNGSGKTTFIRMLCGLLLPDSGDGQCLGYDIIKNAYDIKLQVGYMPQRFSLYDDLSIAENLEFIARIYNMENILDNVEDSLIRLGLMERRNQLVSTLSGGWKQRLALAAALLHKPKLLLLDEPTAGVDPRARRDFWDNLHQLSEEGITILVSTHYMDEAARCHKLAYIVHGHILATGTEDEIIDASGLKTWAISGTRLLELRHVIDHQFPQIQTTLFGNELHVSSTDDSLLETVKQKLSSENWKWRLTHASLEDIFIYLVNQRQENP